jgi:hypothetical protein
VAAAVPRVKTPEEIALREQALERAQQIGMALPPNVRDAIDGLEPLPGEDEPAFAERQRELELDAISDEFLTEALLWQRYGNEIYRVGDSTSRHRAEASARLAELNPVQRQTLYTWALHRVNGPASPRFWPPEQSVPYDGPGAEPLPPNFRWAEPELYYTPDAPDAPDTPGTPEE